MTSYRNMTRETMSFLTRDGSAQSLQAGEKRDDLDLNEEMPQIRGMLLAGALKKSGEQGGEATRRRSPRGGRAAASRAAGEGEEA